MFRVAPWFTLSDLEKLFRYKVFKMLLSRKKITEDLVDMMMGWRHSGFNVYCGPRIQPGEEEAMVNLARYIIRASFSQDRMTYIPDESKVKGVRHACPVECEAYSTGGIQEVGQRDQVCQ
jgi:hypothetical protein